ncbi:MAG: HAMP domain-containing protein [Deltaproteobacteria bacterium]|nr:HAMP domain-containing protein [Deltaproteobacteria bacterium]
MSIRLRLLLIMILLIFAPLAIVFWFGLREFMSDKVRDIDSFAQDDASNFAMQLKAELSKIVELQRLIVERRVIDSKERFEEFVAGRFDAQKNFFAVSLRLESETPMVRIRADFEKRLGVPSNSFAGFVERTASRPIKPGFLDLGAFPGVGDRPLLWFRANIPVRMTIVPRGAAGKTDRAESATRAATIFLLANIDVARHEGRIGSERTIIDRTGSALLKTASVQVGSVVSNPLAEVFRTSPRGGDAAGDGTGAAITKSYRVGDRDVIGALAPLSGTDAAVIVEFSKKLATDALEGLTQKAVLIVAAVFIVAAIVALFFARSIVNPIERLTLASHAIAKGDFHVDIDVRAKNEVGVLSTAFKQMQEGLVQRDTKLEQARMELIQSEKLSALGRMSAGITHELKNPLAGIIGFAQLGQRVLAEDHQVTRYLKLIEKEGKRTKEIIDSLLKFARKEEVKFEKISLNKVAEDAMTLVAHQLATMGVKVFRELDVALPDIRGAFNQLEQVLINLLVNAAQAMEKSGGGKITVSTRAADGGTAEIRVADTGCGIPPENVSRIFDPFFTSKEPGKGTGLGLSVTLGIVKAHNGTIDVDSTVNVGTTFRLKFPLWDGAATGDNLVTPGVEEKSGLAATSLPPTS